MFCLQVNVIGDGSDLVFGDPIQWRAEFTPKLYKDGRIKPIQISELNDKGARHYCWLSPSEPFLDANGGVAWTAPEHGAFVYLFHDEPLSSAEQDRLFPIRLHSNDELARCLLCFVARERASCRAVCRTG